MSTAPELDIEFFSASGPTTDLSYFGDHITRLSKDPAEAAAIVRGLLSHNLDAETNGITLSPVRDGMQLFGAGPTINRVLSIDPAALNNRRPPERKLVGYCYHFALLHCALLRSKNIPSRARCGFANYLIDGKWTDHWVVEYWDGDQWLLNDPQVGLNNLSPDEFSDGVLAWQLCRNNEANPADYGIGNLWGWDELRGSLVNDLGALDKIEIGHWDWCEFLQTETPDQPHPTIDIHLDNIAALATPGHTLADFWEVFRQDTLIRPPDSVVKAACGLQ